MKELDGKAELVYLWVRAYIEENKFSSSTKIPSEHTLCRKLAVSRETVRRALEHLTREGLLRRVKGSGTYINKEAALSWELGGSGGKLKIGLILQGQDGNANSSLMEGIRSILPPTRWICGPFSPTTNFPTSATASRPLSTRAFRALLWTA